MSYANITNPANFQLQDFAQFGFRVITTDFIPVPGEQYRTLYVLQDAVVTATTQKGDDITSKAILAGTLLHGLFNSVSITSGRVLAYAAGRVTADEIIALYESYVSALGGTLENTQCAVDAINEDGVDLFADASLVMIPEGYATGVVYGQRPLTSDSQLTFSRASTATRVNSAGLIETVNSNVPRLDYLGSTCPKLLLEPQRTNLVPNALAYQPATGVLYNTAVSGSPMAGINCARITKNEAAGTLRFAQQQCSSSVLAGSTGYVLSAFFKHDGVDFDTSMEFNNSGNFGGISWNQFINIASTGVTLGTSTSCTSTVENWGGGWYRVNVRITTGAAPSGSFITYLMRLPSTLSTGQGFLHALPQFELGAYQTTYIPTTSAAVTRLADTCSKTGISSLIGQTEGTLFVEVNLSQLLGATGREIFILSNGDAFGASDSVFVAFSGAGSNLLRARVSNPSGVIKFDQQYTVTSTGNYKIAFAYKSGDCRMYVNGSFVGTIVQNDPFTITLDRVLTSFTGTLQFADGIAQALVFKTRLTNEQLQKLTSL